MNFLPKQPPRHFTVGLHNDISLKDCGSLHLDVNEQITLIQNESEIDITAKEFGYYLTPSMNSRMPRFGLTARLIRNRETGHIFVLAVLENRIAEYQAYCDAEGLEEIINLSDPDISARLDQMKEG